MRIDLATRDLESPPTYDLCIIGSGPAGTTVANELRGRGLSICVLESGRARRTALGEELKGVESEGIHVKDYSRERILGGASTTWAGLSSPFDPIDFEVRPAMAVSGWPIERRALFPYYEAAALRYRFAAPEDFAPTGFARVAERGDLRPRFERVEEKVFLACAEPQNFAKEFRELWDGPDVHLYLDATVTGLVSSQHGADGEEVVHAARVRTGRGQTIEFRARAFVLAAGGIENARLLLVSRDGGTNGLGNAHDQVGRHLMNHPKNYHGILHLAQPVQELPYFFGCVYRGFAGYAGLRLTEDEQRSRGLLNSYVRFEPLFPWSDNEGVESLVLLAKRAAFLKRAFTRTKGEGVVELRDYSETGDDSALQNERKNVFGWLGVLWNLVRHSPSVLAYVFFRLAKRSPKVRRVRLRNFMEMEPHPENRVTLSARTDSFGSPRARVVHRCTELDQRSLVELHRELQREFAANGLGRLDTELAVGPDWPIDQDASHHMGTTRMGSDPKNSVVDPDARVWGTANLFAAGASVLPTSGCANPTYTLVALAIRLSEHLAQQLGAAERRP